MHDSTRRAFRPRFALTPVALVACALLQGHVVLAQDQSPLLLRPSPMLRDDIPGDVARELPVFVEGDHIQGRPDLETVIEGGAQLRMFSGDIRLGQFLKLAELVEKKEAEVLEV